MPLHRGHFPAASNVKCFMYRQSLHRRHGVGRERHQPADVELRGQQLKAGDKITVWYPSANRDDDVFERPFDFDIGRTPNPHLGFGGRGPHFCLGSNLARLEIRIMFEELLRRLPDIELAAPPTRLRSNFIGGVKHMPVRFTPERRSPSEVHPEPIPGVQVLNVASDRTPPDLVSGYLTEEGLRKAA